VRDLLKALKALSDETRLRILNLLMGRECCGFEVMQVLDISQSRASRNPGTLYDAGFLKMRRDGLWTLYSIDREGMIGCCPDLIDVVRSNLAGNLNAERDLTRLQAAERIGPGCCS